MSIQTRIHLLQVIIGLAIIAAASVAFFDLRTSLYYLNRTQLARQQLAATSQLAISANRYSEQIAELLLIGEPERPDFDSARMQVREAFRVLRETTIAEAASTIDPQDREPEELLRVDQMRALFGEIDRAVERVLLLDQIGQSDEAVSLFRSEIENRLDADFARLIETGLEDERQEVRQIEADLTRISEVLTIVTLVVAIALLCIVVIAGVLFARSLQRPIKALTDGALAIERGDFDHRIELRGRDELALLSMRFNHMARQLGLQRSMLVGQHEELERQVAERTEQLGEANRRLMATDQQRLSLLTDVSHELRTPLTALRGGAEVALRGASKPEAAYREALSTVVAQSADLSRLVEDFLFLARSEADEIGFDFRPVNLKDLVRKAVREAGILGRERNIRIEIDADTQDVSIRGDPRRLHQVFLIVLDNAVKYADPNTVVAVELRADGQTAALSFRDKGPGVAADDVEQVFERFFRGVNARDKWAGGAGLGLPIARWIVEKHGGTIELSSIVGEGTELLLHFPTSG